MRIKIKMLFTGDGLIPFEDKWNTIAATTANKMFSGAIALWEDDADLKSLEELFARYAATGRVQMSGCVKEAIYSDAELFAEEILVVEFAGSVRAVPGAQDTSFKQSELCVQCHRTVLKQVDVIGVDSVDSGSDAAFIFDDVEEFCLGRAVSNRFAAELAGSKIPGVECRRLLDSRGQRRHDFQQLIVKDRLPPLHERTHLERETVCEKCGVARNLFRAFVTDTRDEELWFPPFDTEKLPIALTREAFGGTAVKTDGHHELIMAGTLYRAFVESGLKGLVAVPAHLSR